MEKDGEFVCIINMKMILICLLEIHVSGFHLLMSSFCMNSTLFPAQILRPSKSFLAAVMVISAPRCAAY